MTKFRGVIEFVLFVASVLKVRFTFCLTAQNIHQLGTTFFFNKIDIRIPNYKHIPISTLIIQLIIYKQQFLYSDWLRTCQLISNQCKKV